METEMKMTLKTTSALILAAMVSVAPALANDSAKVVSGMKTDAVPVANLVSMIGEWTAGDLAFLDKATSVKVYDTKQIYPAADLTKIASAETGKNAELTKFRTAIQGDAGLMGWFKTNNIDINRVVAVADPKGNPEIFLY
jgi:hypothetical protein